MAQMLEQIRMWAEQVVSSLGYIGIALLMFIENIFPPIPSEVIMPFAGSLVTEGKMNFVFAFVAGTIGALAGAVAIYYIGVAVTEDRAQRWFKNYGRFLLMSKNDFDQAMEKFEKHGAKMVFVGRLMPAIRSLISLPAGLNRMQMMKFLLYTTLGTTIWNLLLLGAGFYLGKNWEQVISFVDTYEMVFWIIIGILVAIFVFRRARQSFGSSSDYAESS